MNRTWQLQEAKNKFSEVVDEAVKHGPQRITRRGKEAVVVISSEEFHRLCKAQTPLSRFFAESPLAELDLEVERLDDPPRQVEL